LALSLIEAGYSVKVINNPSLSSSSMVAGGIWNPIVFKRLTKSWLADELVPELITFYEYWEKNLAQLLFINAKSLNHLPNYKKKFVVEKASDIENENIFLDKATYEDLELDKHYYVKSYSKVLHAGNLDVSHF